MNPLSGSQIEIGPQYTKDAPFTARMRFHQSWYRTRVLKAPYGIGPNSGNTTRYGNMLTRADGEKGLNFLTPHIFEVAKRRLAHKKGTIEPFHLLNDLLSGQAMCFNLFGLLVDDLESATHLLRVLLPDEIQTISNVSIEYAPEPAKDYLNDRTTFDTFIAYTDPAGMQGFMGFKTRLAGAFSTKPYSGPAYNRWLDHPAAPWPAGARTQLQNVPVNQLWRDHLLAVALQLSPTKHYASGRFMLVYHPLDAECIAAVEAYKNLLKPENVSFVGVPLDRLVKLWMDGVTTPAHKQWIADFSLRYLDLEASEAEFQVQKARE